MSIRGLQCPRCGHIHSLDEVGPAERFRCRGCRRLLGVPVVSASAAAVTSRPGSAGRAGPAASPGGSRPAGAGGDAEAAGGPPTVAMAAVMRPPPADPGAPPVPSTRPGRAPRVGAVQPPAWLRVAVWMVAIPLGFLAAVIPLRAAGLVDIDHAIDAFAGAGADRFAVLVLLLPLWAGLAATMAHVVLEGVARRRSRARS